MSANAIKAKIRSIEARLHRHENGKNLAKSNQKMRSHERTEREVVKYECDISGKKTHRFSWWWSKSKRAA